MSPALEDIPEEDWYCSGCKEVDIADLKDHPGDFDDAETNDNGKISFTFLPYLSTKIP